MNLFYPEYAITIGDYTVNQGINFETLSSKKTTFDYAKIKLTSKIIDKILFQNGDPVHIQVGYNGSMHMTFSGIVTDNNQHDEIICKDIMIKVYQTPITETFVDASADEVVKYLLSKAGIDDYVLENGSYIRKLFIVNKVNGVELLKLINMSYGIHHSFYALGGTFYWGTEAPGTNMVYNFTYGENIIELIKRNSTWYMTSVALPINHSDTIQVDHPSLSGTFKVTSVKHYTVNGFLRMDIAFTEGGD